ncbi:DUF4355 domain-containing protein [Sporolactobacillus terrae]|uniref:DUF4355 domain-containing protein n=1 Tax=Sporolactobacillus terrae TaxID=269673 RepID=UPI00068896E5|nr:DUF4355 domain-containing protein [Sporolactobacillus terrae]
MDLNEIKTWLNEHKSDSDVSTYLGELSKPSIDGLKGLLDTEEGRKLIQPKLDAHFTKGLETWKSNNLESLIEEEVKKRNPQKSPAEIEVEKLRKEIEDERKARARQELTNKALKVADEKGLPKGVLDFFIGADEETTTANLGKLEETFKAAVQAGVDAKFKQSGRNVSHGSSGNSQEGKFGKELAEKGNQNSEQMQQAQKNYFNEN